MSRTLLALLTPEAEPLIGDLRARLDPAAKLGLGAHITLEERLHLCGPVACVPRLVHVMEREPGAWRTRLTVPLGD